MPTEQTASAPKPDEGLAGIPMPAPPKYRCENCLYSLHPGTIGAEGFVMCRRFPPQVYQSDNDIARNPDGLVTMTRQTLSQFPILRTIQWCGEHKMKKPDQQGK